MKLKKIKLITQEYKKIEIKSTETLHSNLPILCVERMCNILPKTVAKLIY